MHKLAIYLIFSLSAGISIAPALFALGRPQYILIGAALMLIAYIIYDLVKPTQRGIGGAGSETRRQAERYVLFALGSLLPGAVAGLWLLIAYVLLYGVVMVVVEVLSWFGVAWSPQAGALSLNVALVFAVGAILASASMVAEQYGKSFSRHLVRSEERRKRFFRNAAGWFFLIVVLVGIGLKFGVEWLTLGLIQFLLVAVGGTVSSRLGERPALDTIRAVQAVYELLMTGSAEVFIKPVTNDEEIDLLLKDQDFFIAHSGRAFLFDVRAADTTPNPATWRECLGVIAAARILTENRVALEIEAPRVEPVLVLVGCEADVSLKEFAGREEMHLVSLGEPAVAQILKEPTDPAWQQEFARIHFGEMIQPFPDEVQS